jgi:hypothetical protein
MIPDDLDHVLFELAEGLLLSGVGLNPLGSHVGGHYDHRVFEVHRPALGVRQASIVEDLQQDVEDVWVLLLDEIEK